MIIRKHFINTLHKTSLLIVIKDHVLILFISSSIHDDRDHGSILFISSFYDSLLIPLLIPFITFFL